MSYNKEIDRLDAENNALTAERDAALAQLAEHKAAVGILRAYCHSRDGLPESRQTKSPEDMALWAVTLIGRLDNQLAAIEIACMIRESSNKRDHARDKRKKR